MPLVGTPPSRRPAFDVVILAEGANAANRVAGLTLRERARRVVARLGARSVYLVDTLRAREAMGAWWTVHGDAPLLIVRAHDQAVHTPLIAPLLDAYTEGARLLAVTPDDRYAGAMLLAPDAAGEVVAALADPYRREDDVVAPLLRRADVARVLHGDIARAPATTPHERRRATRHLFGMIHKAQDGPVTRWLYRPVSAAITRVLLATPITPNQVSALVAVLGVVGVALTASASYPRVIVGSAVILFAGYLDGCDGEIARLKLMSSKLGAWLDTVTDELTTVGYFCALGVHLFLRHDDAAVLAVTGVGVIGWLVSIAGVYYELIVVLGSANSQDYVGAYALDLEARALVPVPATASASVTGRALTVATHVARRDFVNWATLGLAIAHLTEVSYGLMLLGGIVGGIMIGVQHLRLRRQVGALRAADQAPGKASDQHG